MAIYLDEDMVGTDPNMIAFPHLVLCMGVVLVMGDGSLIGAHFTQPTTEQPLLRLMADKVRSNGSGMDQIYCMAEIAQHVGQHGGLDIHGKANALGFRGQGYVADFGVLNPRDGTYAQVTSNGAGNRATVRCKVNDEMQYTYGAGSAVAFVRRMTGQSAGGEAWASTRMTTRNTSTIGAAADFLNTPFLSPVTIT